MRVVCMFKSKYKHNAVICIALAAVLIMSAVFSNVFVHVKNYVQADSKPYITWVDFGVTNTAMRQAMKYDVDSQKEKIKINWIDLLAAAACKNGGKFSEKADKNIDNTAEKLKNGEKIEEITGNTKYFKYYQQAYNAVLGGMLGTVKREVYDETSPNQRKVKEYYGLKAYSPIAYGYGFSHSDDFGTSRNYGFSRTHKGNDLMGTVGTPIVSVEDGIVECMGWNKYGGWRIGIRSLDYKRYYYYAHLRRGHPYVNTLKEGMTVKAGDVIGYLGMTGYSDNEDYNGMKVPHLHFGIQIIFDESQKDGNGEIWIDAYQIVNFLQQNRSAVIKDEASGDYQRKYKTY